MTTADPGADEQPRRRPPAPHIHSRSFPRPGAPPDRLGVVHEAGRDDVITALGLPQRGDIYDLDPGRWNAMPSSPAHPRFLLTSYRTPHGLALSGEFGGAEGVYYSSEVMVGTAHTGTHIDALGHLPCRTGTTSDAVGDFGLVSSDAASMAPFVCRGVLADVATMLDVPRLDADHEITPADLQQTLTGTGVVLRPGDAVLIRTGWITRWLEADPADPPRRQPGIGRAAARWLARQGVCLVGGDTSALERVPSDDPLILPAHVELLHEAGVHIVEMAYLEDLSHDRVSSFLFICLPLRIQGATGSMVRPIAIV
jgi:kynurenine formamidase